MHIIAAAWLYVTLTMALTFGSAWAGFAFFGAVGMGPLVLLAWLAVRRHRARVNAASVLEPQVNTADHRDAKSDQ